MFSFAKDVFAPVIPKEQLSLLILGQTGVGKSTLVNFLTNMVRPKNLTENSFTNCPAAASASADSVTKSTNCYVIENSKFRFNIFDTPGFSDTNGPKQDAESVRDILSSLFRRNITVLNGIMLVVNGTNYRLTEPFIAVLNQILAQFVVVGDRTSAIPIILVGTHVGLECQAVDLKQLEQALNQKAFFVRTILMDNMVCKLNYLSNPKYGQVLVKIFCLSGELLH